MKEDLRKIKAMKRGGAILSKVMARAIEFIRPGVTFAQTEKLIDNLIAAGGAKPSFKMVPGYHWASCINVNEGVVHGIPEGRKFHKKDLVSLDIGAFYQGYHTDMSYSWEIENNAYAEFLAGGEKALDRAIKSAKSGGVVMDISRQIEKNIEGAGIGYCSRDLTGHGIGEKLHQRPFIACFVDEFSEDGQMVLKQGQTLAIEVIYLLGGPDIKTEKDGWTISSKNGKISSLFEKTIMVGRNGGEVLTSYFWKD